MNTLLARKSALRVAVVATLLALVGASLLWTTSRADAGHNSSPLVPTFEVTVEVSNAQPTSASLTVTVTNTAHFTLLKHLELTVPGPLEITDVDGGSFSGEVVSAQPDLPPQALNHTNPQSDVVTIDVGFDCPSDGAIDVALVATANGPFPYFQVLRFFSGITLNFERQGDQESVSIPCAEEEPPAAQQVPPPGDTTTTTEAGDPPIKILIQGLDPAEGFSDYPTALSQLFDNANFSDDHVERRFCVGSACVSLVNVGDTSAELFGGSTAFALYSSIQPADNLPDACGEDFDAIGDAVVFDVKGFTHSSPWFAHHSQKVVEMTITGVQGEADDFDVCFGGEEEFEQKDGDAAVEHLGFWFGILPDCADDDGEPWTGDASNYWDGEDALAGGNYGPAPCVAQRTVDTETDALTVVVLAPPGDPIIKIG